MHESSLTHLADADLLQALQRLVLQNKGSTAWIVAHIAEFDRRRQYAVAGYSSLFAFCLGELRLSEDAACNHIDAARRSRECPGLLPALADGRIHLSSIRLLVPHLTAENADEMIALATHRPKRELEILLAERFPKVEALRLDEGIAALGSFVAGEAGSAPGRIPLAHPLSAPGRIPPISPQRVEPLTARRYSIQVTVSKATHDKIRQAQALLRHANPSGDLAIVLDCMADAFLLQKHKRKPAASERPQAKFRSSNNPRHVPARVRRAVWERDAGTCTFVGDTGHRCGAREFLEFDHVTPVARGGSPSVDGMRLRCRTHNQLEAERVFGRAFMEKRRSRTHRATESQDLRDAEFVFIPGKPGVERDRVRDREQDRDQDDPRTSTRERGHGTLLAAWLGGPV